MSTTDVRTSPPEPMRRRPQLLRDDPHLVQGRDRLPAPRQGVLRRHRRRDGGLRGADAEARLHRRPGRHGHLAAAVLPVAAPRRRVRHRRLRAGAPRLRNAARLPELRARGAPARASRDHRARRQPHLRPAPVVRRVAVFASQPEARLVRVERHRPEVRRRPDHLHRHRDLATGRGTRSPSSTTGIGSSATSRTSTTTTPRSSGRSCG